MAANKQHGFTLIELAITLVIIGLLVGGVLVGRDLIKSAEIRSQVSQINEFNMAANVFKQKYNYLPGDIPQTEASANGFWFCAVGDQLGNGNGYINDHNSLFLPSSLYCEPVLFFTNLSQAKLIRGYSSTTNGQYTVEAQFPRVKLGQLGGIAAASNANYELTWFLGITNTNTAFNYCTSYSSCSTYKIFTPQEAYSFDIKIDDGLPMTGVITNTTTPIISDTTSNSCITSTTNNTYNVTNTNRLCNLLVTAGKF